MKYRIRLCTALLLLSSVAIHAPAFAKKTSASAENVIGEINGEAVHQGEVDDILNRLSLERQLKEKLVYKNLKPEEKSALFNEIATKRMLEKAIENSKIAEEKNVKQLLERVQKETLQREFLSRKVKEAVTQKQVKARYDEMAKLLKDKEEFKIHHIQVESEKEAKDIAEQLKKNPGEFEEIAKKKSKDPSNANGGDMGYLLQDTILKEIQDAAMALKKDEISTPIKTQLGWHIIRLDDRRKTTIAPFDTIKVKVEEEVSQQALQNYLSSLVKDAKIKINE